MAEGFPGVERLRSGRYRARVWNPSGYNPKTRANGRREPLPGTFETAQQAHDAKVAAEYRMDAAYRELGREVRRNVASVTAHMTVGDVCWAWLADQRWASVRTHDSTANYCKQIERAFFGMEASKLDREMILRWRREQIDRGISPISRNARLSVLRRSLQRAVDNHILAVNVAADIVGEPLRNKKRQKGRLPTEREFALATYFMPGWLWPTLFLARDAGFRAQEVCGLQWRNVHIDDGKPWVMVSDTIGRNGNRSATSKHGKVRAVPLSRDAANALRSHRDRFPPKSLNERVFQFPANNRHPAKDHITQDNLAHYWRVAREMSGMADHLPMPRFHDLRHLTGTTLMRAGVPIEDARVFMGHEDYRTLQIYVEESPIDRLHDAVSAAWG